MISIEKQNFKGLKAIIRVDFNVPVDTNNKVLDSSRIEAAKPTILKVINDGGSCILMSNWERPKKKETTFSLTNIIPEIEKIIKLKLKLLEEALWNKTKEITKKLRLTIDKLIENRKIYTDNK